jgi:hypothetical protein
MAVIAVAGPFKTPKSRENSILVVVIGLVFYIGPFGCGNGRAMIGQTEKIQMGGVLGIVIGGGRCPRSIGHIAVVVEVAVKYLVSSNRWGEGVKRSIKQNNTSRYPQANG